MLQDARNGGNLEEGEMKHGSDGRTDSAVCWRLRNGRLGLTHASVSIVSKRDSFSVLGGPPRAGGGKKREWADSAFFHGVNRPSVSRRRSNFNPPFDPATSLKKEIEIVIDIAEEMFAALYHLEVL